MNISKTYMIKNGNHLTNDYGNAIMEFILSEVEGNTLSVIPVKTGIHGFPPTRE